MNYLSIENPYIREFTAEIIDILEKDGKYHLELDRSFFYPGGNAIPMDTGFINSNAINEVYVKEDKIYHIVEMKPMKIHRVKCSINYSRRFDFMQQQMGSYVLSAAALDLFDCSISKTQIAECTSFIEVDKAISSDNISKIEAWANEIVLNNHVVERQDKSKTEYKKLIGRTPALRNLALDDIIFVKLGEVEFAVPYDIHLKSTSEVQLIKVTGCTYGKTSTRIEFICGKRAVSDYFSKSEKLDRLSKLLACDINEMPVKIEHLTNTLKSISSEQSNLKARVADFEVQNILNKCTPVKDVKIVRNIYEAENIKDINSLASKLITFPRVIVLFGVITPENTHLIFMKSKDIKAMSMNTLLKDAITLIDGNGGGSEYSAKGGGKSNNNLNSCLDYAYNKLINSI